MHRKQTYSRRIERSYGRKQYIVTLCRDSGDDHDVVVTEAVYDLIGEITRQDRHLSHQDERHSEFSELSDESIYRRAFIKPKLMEDAVLDRLFVGQVLDVIRTLPAIQARRFILRSIIGLTFPEIAKLEGCGARSVKNSVDAATKTIRKKMNC